MNRANAKTPVTEVIPNPLPWLVPQSPSSLNGLISPLEQLSQKFEPISLDEMDGVALLNRLDIKYILTARQLLDALSHLQNDYWMLEVNSRRLNHYRTLYYDTPGFDLYLAHVNGRPERYKVRCREYTDSQQSFLEVKLRTRKDRTIKERIPTGQPAVCITPALKKWLHIVSPLDGCSLEPRLWNTFTRMTLVNKHCCERVTLDVDLIFSIENRLMSLDNIAVAEVKMEQGSQWSPFVLQMREQRVPREGFSKYAFGVAALYDQVKKNAIKPKMLRVEKLMKGSLLDD